MHSLRQRLNVRDESGFTLIELLVVLIIIGVLLAIAIPSYLGFQKSAQQTAAASDVRQAIPDAENYYANNSQDYTGITKNLLQASDPGMLVVGVNGATNGITTVKFNSAADATTGAAVGQEYCISAVDSGQYSGVAGPGGTVVAKLTTDPCAAWTNGVSQAGQPGW
jgi:type IV pilus assembly protein PilA